MIDKNRLAAGPVSGFNITPAISNHVAVSQIDIPALGGIQQQTWARFAAGTASIVVMRTNPDVVQLQIALQPRVDLGDLGSAGGAARDVRLIRNQDESKPGVAQFAASFADTGQDP